MTFPTELEMLLKSYKAEKNAIERFRIEQHFAALLRNHADAILGLVRDMEVIKQNAGNPEIVYRTSTDALAKLNGEGK